MNDYIAPLTEDQFTRETDYQAVRSITKTLLAHGIINQAEYKKIDTILLAKYRPIIGVLQSEKDLI